MPLSLVGPRAAVGAALSALAGFVHGDLTVTLIVGAGTASGLAT
jgi:hypothetical protein